MIFFNYFLPMLFIIGVVLNRADTKRGEYENLEDVSIFDDGFVQRIETQIRAWSAFQRQRALSLLGKLALFARLYRAWMRDPRTGHRGSDKFFPRPAVSFHAWVYEDCSIKYLYCIEMIYSSFQNRSSILFPIYRQHSSNFTFEQSAFTRSVTNTMYAYDISAIYLLCFLTMNRLSILRLLPFCTYGIEPHQSEVWPSALFQDTRSRRNIRRANDFGAEPIDHFIGQNDFECADESFCPDPCCGRRSHRSASGGNFCKRSVCLYNDFQNNSNKNLVDNLDAFSNELNETIPKSETNQKLSDIVSAEEASHACHVEAFFNDDIRAIMENRWNLSCACVVRRIDNNGEDTLSKNGNIVLDPSRIYRFDAKMCVDIDECLYAKCGLNEECMNTLGGYLCVCKLGYLRREIEGGTVCEPMQLSNASVFLHNVLTPP